ncbi:DUF1499 domain-containing protein [Roseibium algae]|uniref:DUF1499 domain-containing protein n=1 Tax=Roseibium algae TaxID=3123038 RepID=A0ABU8TGX8_9HYPH
MKRYPVFSSSSARASRWFGAVALPVAVIGVLAHRLGYLDTLQMFLSILASTLIGLVALLLAILGVIQLWHRGGHGTSSAVIGAFYGILALMPAAVLVAGPFLQGDVLDIATDRKDPPKLERNGVPANLSLPFFMALRSEPSDGQYADIVSRRYRIQPAELHLAAMKAAEGNGWNIVSETQADLLDAPTRFQAEVTTPVLGLVDDVVVRIRPDSIGSLFDMRSASRSTLQDFGGNVARVKAFYRDLDEALLETYGEIDSLAVLEADAELKVPSSVDAVLDDPVDQLNADTQVVPSPAFKPYFKNTEVPAPDDLASEPDLEG